MVDPIAPVLEGFSRDVRRLALTASLFTYTAMPVRVIDGDTFEVILDLGVDVSKRETVRLMGCNTPEIFGAHAVPAGKDAKAFTDSWLREEALWQTVRPPFVPVLLKSHSYNPREKYGRLLVSVVRLSDGADLCTDLLAHGLAVAQ